MIAAFKRWVHRQHWYVSLRYQPALYRLLEKRDSATLQRNAEELQFYQQLFKNSFDLAFDVGANHGHYARYFKRFAKRVVCVEPDAKSLRILRVQFGAVSGVFVEPVAVGSEIGEADFFVEAAGSAYNTLSSKQRSHLNEIANVAKHDMIKVSITTLDNLIIKYGTPTYIKIDVEGFEQKAIQGLSKPIPIISFEANLPEFYNETLSIIDALDRGDVTRYNLRLGNRFIFEQHVLRTNLFEKLNDKERITYDVFVFQHDLIQ